MKQDLQDSNKRYGSVKRILLVLFLLLIIYFGIFLFQFLFFSHDYVVITMIFLFLIIPLVPFIGMVLGRKIIELFGAILLGIEAMFVVTYLFVYVSPNYFALVLIHICLSLAMILVLNEFLFFLSKKKKVIKKET